MATTTGKLAPPATSNDPDYRQKYQVYGLLTGEAGWGGPVDLIDNSDDTRYELVVQNQGALGLHIQVPGILTVNNGGMGISALTVNTDLTVGRDLTVDRNALVDGQLGVAGLSTLSTVSAAATTVTDLTVTGNTILGDASSDTVTVTATPTFATHILMSAAASQIVPGATSWAVRNHADSADNVRVSDAGGLTVRNALTVTAGNLTVTAGEIIMAAAASLIVPGATSLSLRNHADSADNLLISDAGAATIRAGLTVTAGGATITAGNLAVSAGTITGSSTVQGTQLISTVVGAIGSGTAPLSVLSQKVVPNLNASFLNDKLDSAFIQTSGGANGTMLGDLLFSSDNAHDIGASGATRPRTIYYGTRIFGVGGEATQKAPVAAVCSGNLTLSSAAFTAPPSVTFDVPGCSISLTIGRWIVIGVLYCSEIGAGDIGNVAVAQLVTNSATATISDQTSLAVCSLQAASWASQGSQVWNVQVTVAGTLVMQARKGGGTGTSTANVTHTTLTAIYAGNDV